jgi:hypothetical protein
MLAHGTVGFPIAMLPAKYEEVEGAHMIATVGD